MAYSIEYFHARVQAAIEAWPVDVVADYARIVERLIEHGPSLRLPHSRAFGDGLFELRPVVNRALIERSIVILLGSAWLCCMLSLKNRSKHRSKRSRLRASE